MDFGVRAKYDPAFPLVSWHHGQFSINLTNVMAICCRMPMAELVQQNAEMSLLGRLNPAMTQVPP